MSNTIDWGKIHYSSWSPETNLTGTGGGIDSDAQAFITAASITDSTQESAINTLVTDLKGYGVWTKMKAIYPFVGGTASSHKFNLKDPQDTDAAFRLTFQGGITHSATGMLPNGFNGKASTHIVPGNEFSSGDELAYGYYSRDTSDNDSPLSYDMGAFRSLSNNTMIIRYNGNYYLSANIQNYVTGANANTDGLFVSTRTASNALAAYRNGSLLFSRTTASKAMQSSVDFEIGGTTGYYGFRECAFCFIYNGGLDLTQNQNLYNAVQAFQTTLSRQV